MEEVPLTRDPLFDKEKFVFAVDLVLHVVDEEWPLENKRSRDISDYYTVKDLVYPNFTEVARQAVDNLRQQLRNDVRDDYTTMINNNVVLDSAAFKSCVDAYIEKFFFGVEFNARSLFKFAVSVALLAGHLLNHPGVQIEYPPELACNAIVNRFPHPDMDYDLRTTLNKAAEHYAQLNNVAELDAQD